MPLKIREALAAFDGKDTETLRLVAESLPPTADSLRELLDLAGDASDPVEIGATWVVKSLLESGTVASITESWRVVSLLQTVRSWESSLHLLQCLPYCPLEAPLQKSLHRVLCRLLAADNKFVKAWAYNGFAELARANPDYTGEALARFDEGEVSEAASVRARIRHARKKL